MLMRLSSRDSEAPTNDFWNKIQIVKVDQKWMKRKNYMGKKGRFFFLNLLGEAPWAKINCPGNQELNDCLRKLDKLLLSDSNQITWNLPISSFPGTKMQLTPPHFCCWNAGLFSLPRRGWFVVWAETDYCGRWKSHPFHHVKLLQLLLMFHFFFGDLLIAE